MVSSTTFSAIAAALLATTMTFSLAVSPAMLADVRATASASQPDFAAGPPAAGADTAGLSG